MKKNSYLYPYIRRGEVRMSSLMRNSFLFNLHNRVNGCVDVFNTIQGYKGPLLVLPPPLAPYSIPNCQQPELCIVKNRMANRDPKMASMKTRHCAIIVITAAMVVRWIPSIKIPTDHIQYRTTKIIVDQFYERIGYRYIGKVYTITIWMSRRCHWRYEITTIAPNEEKQIILTEQLLYQRDFDKHCCKGYRYLNSYNQTKKLCEKLYRLLQKADEFGMDWIKEGLALGYIEEGDILKNINDNDKNKNS